MSRYTNSRALIGPETEKWQTLKMILICRDRGEYGVLETFGGILKVFIVIIILHRSHREGIRVTLWALCSCYRNGIKPRHFNLHSDGFLAVLSKNSVLPGVGKREHN